MRGNNDTKAAVLFSFDGQCENCLRSLKHVILCLTMARTPRGPGAVKTLPELVSVFFRSVIVRLTKIGRFLLDFNRQMTNILFFLFRNFICGFIAFMLFFPCIDFHIGLSAFVTLARRHDDNMFSSLAQYYLLQYLRTSAEGIDNGCIMATIILAFDLSKVYSMVLCKK